MTNISRVALDSRAELYIREELRSRLSLARFVAQENPRFTRVYALGGAGLAVEPNDDFRHAPRLGEQARMPFAEQSVAALSEVLSSWMLEGRCRSILFEDLLARPSDERETVDPPQVLFAGEVYVQVADGSTDSIADAISAATNYPEVLGIGSTRAVHRDDAGRALLADQSSLVDFARHTAVIVLGAYDGDAFIVAETELLG